jgi:methionyl-tRNA synthetase
MKDKRRILVTSALPYANGPLHFGHIIEAVQTDVWVRFQRARGHEAYYCCADDTHGTPIMLKAEQEGVTPEQLIARIQAEHERDYAGFLVRFDRFHSTHSPENKAFVEGFYTKLKAAGHITTRTIEQAYDAEKGMFLPDRFIKGECPRCGTPDQYGDACESCGATYSPADLKNPRSVLSGTAPVTRASEHHFFKLGAFTEFLKQWTAKGVDDSVRAKLDEWFVAGLNDWDISRDAPYFGFEIPGAPGKYFYVWLDAPMGYMASFKALCDDRARGALPLKFNEFWAADAQGKTELYHSIGKDITYFHTLFWPAVLKGAGYRVPDAVFVHGFLTVDGAKMSKSRGTFIMARTYLEHLDPEYLRYYFAAKLGAGVEDIDLNLTDFVARVNADLVGKFVNIGSRAIPFISKHFDGKLLPPGRPGAVARATAAVAIADAFEARRYSDAVRQIMKVADDINAFVDQHTPWLLAKQMGDDPAKRAELHRICSEIVHGFHALAIWLAPILPRTGERVARELFGVDREFRWADLDAAPAAVAPYQHLITRIDPLKVNAMVDASKDNMPQVGVATLPAIEGGPLAPQCTLEDFQKVDLRVARIAKAESVEGADKLLKLTLELGDHGVRTVFAGIKSAYHPATIEGRLTVVVANLAPRKMKFGTSDGMVLAAGPGGRDLFLLSPDAGVKPGMKVK